MFLSNVPKNIKHVYAKSLEIVAKDLSTLHSGSDEPYLAYRALETIFNKTFRTTDLTREDLAIDVSRNSTGIGLKTFIGGHSQKIAEFDKEKIYVGKGDKLELAIKIAKKRNKRISYAVKKFKLKKLYYHIVYRTPGALHVYENEMHPIHINSIKNVRRTKTSLFFEDRYAKYRYYIAKNTLFQTFDLSVPLIHIEIKEFTPFTKLIKKLMKKG